MDALIYPIGNSAVLRLTGLRDRAGDLVPAATLTATVRDPAGTAVEDATLTLSPVDGEVGTYEAAVAYDLALVASARYTVDLEGSASGARLYLPGIPLRARVRTD